MRHLRRAVVALGRTRKRIARALSGPTSVALFGVTLLGVGIDVVFGLGWSLIVVGSLSLFAAVRLATVGRR